MSRHPNSACSLSCLPCPSRPASSPNLSLFSLLYCTSLPVRPGRTSVSVSVSASIWRTLNPSLICLAKAARLSVRAVTWTKPRIRRSGKRMGPCHVGAVLGPGGLCARGGAQRGRTSQIAEQRFRDLSLYPPSSFSFSSSIRSWIFVPFLLPRATFDGFALLLTDGRTDGRMDGRTRGKKHARRLLENEGVEVVAEEPAKPVPPRGSGSKRSRAAEVHNLSEKRRRSRINEKMKALQNLIPNSNKTDKASMLDEAIEYLKQLQLQVQMLSMRNGLNHPMYLFGALQPLPASQMCMGFGADNGTAMSMGLGMLPLNQDSAARNSFDPSNRSTPSHRSIVIPSVKNVSNPENSCKMEPSQSHQAPFQLPASAEEIFTEDMVARPQLAAGQTTRNLPENEMKCIAVAASQHFGGQPSSLVDDDNLEECAIGRERPEDMLSKDPENLILVQHLHGLQAGISFSSADAKDEPLHF